MEQEFEVEDILRYRRNDEGEEYFLVKWVGFPPSQATWEPLAHMNDNCRELIAKARALFAWRRPSAAPTSGSSPGAAADAGAPELVSDGASGQVENDAQEGTADGPRKVPSRSKPDEVQQHGSDANITIEDA